MGTKRQLAPTIRDIIANLRPGPVLDLFAGMCSVGAAVAPQRPVWSNDLQAFSQQVAEALFCTQTPPPQPWVMRERLKATFGDNMRAMGDLHGELIDREDAAIALGDDNALAALFETQINRDTFSSKHHYSLFVERFGCLYFGARQCAELDSLRCAMDNALMRGEMSTDEFRWLVVAAGVAMSKCTTSTGHFAQPLMPKASTIKRHTAQRRRSILSETWSALAALRPIGTPEWRNRNRAFRKEALQLLSAEDLRHVSPAVVYADPPYTADQYSRYYHLYETWVLYDHPTCAGRGRYRPDRASSAFSCPAQAPEAVFALIRSVAALGADLVISYPAKGVVRNSEERIVEAIRESYGRTPDVLTISHSHSTMGASKGSASNGVYEKLYAVAA